MDGKAYESMGKAHREIWRRFVDPHGILLDFAGLEGEVIMPTPEDCKEGRINALGWWTPIENGAFFSGLYLDAMCNAWKLAGEEDKKNKARKLAQGLVLLATAGSSPGFVARGLAADGKSHYRIGSDDQTAPWFYGLWKYCKSGIPAEAEKAEIIALMRKVAQALQANGWLVPCDGMAENRGEFIGGTFRDASRLLFMLRAMHDLTGEARWLDEYHIRLLEKPEGSDKTRLEICECGMSIEIEGDAEMAYAMWIIGGAQASLKALAQMEQNEEIRSGYRNGMRLNGYMALPLVCRYFDFDAGEAGKYDINWTVMNALWKPQGSVGEAVKLARLQIEIWEKSLMPARFHENRYMREPLFAAWIVALSDDRGLAERSKGALAKCLCHYDWSKLYTSLFFIAECAYYEMLCAAWL
jgi:hypothetical protein